MKAEEERRTENDVRGENSVVVWMMKEEEDHVCFNGFEYLIDDFIFFNKIIYLCLVSF